jgi:hypothetical protein
MDKTARREVLRRRFKALGGLRFPTSSPRTRSQPVPQRGSGKPLAVFYGVALAYTVPRWVAEADEVPEVPTMKPRRIARKSPLAAIAEKWADALRQPRKSPFLASRR